MGGTLWVVANFIRRVGRFVKGLARDKSIPRWAKGLLAFAALPVPGPIDEAVGLVVAGFLFARHRDVVARHWRLSASAREFSEAG